MKICTVNVPNNFIEIMKRLIHTEDNPEGLYASRSELIRYALKEYIKAYLGGEEIRELLLEKVKRPKDGWIQVPRIKKNDKGEEEVIYTQHRVIREA